MIKHLRIQPAHSIKLIVSAVFRESARVKYGYLVGKLYCGKTMCDQYRTFSFNDRVKICIDLILGYGIERGGRFIKQENASAFINRFRHGYLLRFHAGGRKTVVIFPF